MIEVQANKASRYDPTHTTVLRNAFVRNMKKRFNELIKVVIEGVDKQDCFALKEKEGITVQQMSAPGNEAFRFMRDPAKIDAFMQWLERQVDKGILEIATFPQLGQAIEQAWTNMYIADSYKRGIQRARYELIRAGYTNIADLEQSGGIDAIFSAPYHMDRVGLIYTRAYSGLKGITAAMENQISQVLAQGMLDGDGPALLARKLIAVIEGRDMGTLGITDTLGRFIPAATRASMLARTEIIRAHHLATIQEYRNWGVEGVFVMAEWMTAGDDRVCDKCNSLQGKIFTLDEIEGMIPLHPNCRCIALPYLEELKKYY
jgi:SPP1 gp7 family putative phage head morphogenesis protein